MKLTILLMQILMGIGASANDGYQPRPLQYKGKDIFILGNWDLRWGTDKNDHGINPFLQQAGANCYFRHLRLSKPEELKKEMEIIKWFNRHRPEITIVVGLDLQFILKNAGEKKFIPVPANELPERRASFRKVLTELSKLDNVIGYYVDELENRLHGTYGEWKKTQKLADTEMDIGLTRYMETAIAWITEDIKTYHPGAYFMPVQAWWTTYDQSDKLYDVLVANQYPSKTRLQSDTDMYSVAYDAQKAAEAVKKLNKQCFIYCPAGFDILGSQWENTKYDIDDIRYMWFMPITYGAQGIMGWRMFRCSDQFAKTIILPVINEISALTPWFLGERMDKQIKCSNEGWTEYKVRRRSRMMGSEDEEFDIRKVKTITYILRRNPADQSILMLAANNSSREESALFTLKDLSCNYALDLSNGQRMGFKGNIRVKFAPFSVRAYLISDAPNFRKP